LPPEIVFNGIKGEEEFKIITITQVAAHRITANILCWRQQHCQHEPGAGVG